MTLLQHKITCPLPEINQVTRWLIQVTQQHEKEIEELNYIFCSDDYLYQLNKQYLNHDSLTDVITFDLSEQSQDVIIGEAYISVDRVKENAKQFDAIFTYELLRVMVHALLHLLGYKDETPEEKEQIHALEDYWIGKLRSKESDLFENK
ncbi:MAG: rRNA maturation RNase YbeY [Bacteroidota bacterium]